MSDTTEKQSRTVGVRLSPAQQELELRLRDHIGVSSFSELVRVLLKDGERAYLQQNERGAA
jgi:hypothetical protein